VTARHRRAARRATKDIQANVSRRPLLLAALVAAGIALIAVMLAKAAVRRRSRPGSVTAVENTAPDAFGSAVAEAHKSHAL